jgi:hypothetical protein
MTDSRFHFAGITTEPDLILTISLGRGSGVIMRLIE